MRILVTGGAGYIGSHTTLALIERGDEVTIVDNLSNGSTVAVDRVADITGVTPTFHCADVRNRTEISDIVASSRPDAVIHFAGLKAVGESVERPLHYYAHNLESTFALLEAMEESDVRRLVFSSSATVYGGGQEPPYTEDDGPFVSSNPYGQTKAMLERILTDIAASDPRWSIAILRYFNPIGAHQSGLIGEDPHGRPNNLAPYVSQVAVGRLPEVTVHGDDYDTSDGTGERDYIHVVDLAAGHAAAVSWVASHSGARVWNLGTGVPTSVIELIEAFRAASGAPIPYRIGPRRAGDLDRSWADASRAERELGWLATRGITAMAADSWNWQSKNPDGYRSPGAQR